VGAVFQAAFLDTEFGLGHRHPPGTDQQAAAGCLVPVRGATVTGCSDLRPSTTTARRTLVRQ
jgi:hypothetical protein